MTMRFIPTVAWLSALALPVLSGCQPAGPRTRASADVGRATSDGAGGASVARGGPGDGGGTSEADGEGGGTSFTTPVRGDVDGDGLEDLVRFKRFTGRPGMGLRPLSGTADWPEWRLAIVRGRTGVEGIYETASAPGSVPRVQLADLNCDGVPEILAYTLSVPSPNVRTDLHIRRWTDGAFRQVFTKTVSVARPDGRILRSVTPEILEDPWVRCGTMLVLRPGENAIGADDDPEASTIQRYPEARFRLDTASGAVVPTSFCPRETRTEATFEAYRLVVRAGGEFAGCPPGESFEVFRGGRSVFDSEAAGIHANHVVYGGPLDWFQIGEDVTGDGRPDLILRGFQRGCFLDHVFVYELGETFRPLLSLGRLCNCTPGLEDPDDDGIPEIIAGDAVYDELAEVPTTDAGLGTGPAAVVWKYRGDHYESALDLMRKPPLAEAEFDALVREHREKLARTEHSRNREEGLAGHVLERIYSGNAAQGWRLFDLAWPAGDPRKAEVREILARGLRWSGYWATLSELNAPEPVVRGDEAWRAAEARDVHDSDVPDSVELDSDLAQLWIGRRFRNAALGAPERVRIPLVVRSDGWGCDCPSYYIGCDTTNEGILWLDPKTRPDLPDLPRAEGAGHILIAEGWFNGATSVDDRSGGIIEDQVYTVYGFNVDAYREATREDYGDLRLEVLGGPAAPDSPAGP
ncbi:MAG: hypothetical protein HY905_18945 [Deltaproteobacteria bacterium]|nr:hypothetical protein [Deltaproteobacteria bacterium]